MAPYAERLSRDLAGTLAAVRAAGARAVEWPSPYLPAGVPPAAVRAALDDAGLRVSGVQVGTGPLYRRWERALSAAAALGAPHIACAPPGPEERRSPEDWPELVAVLGHAAERARAAGLGFQVRADGWMLAGPPGATPLDRLLAAAGASGAGVGVALDVRAARDAGVDPSAAIVRLGRRLGAILVRPADLSEGAGATLVAAVRAAGAAPVWVAVPDAGARTTTGSPAMAGDPVVGAGAALAAVRRAAAG